MALLTLASLKKNILSGCRRVQVQQLQKFILIISQLNP